MRTTILTALIGATLVTGAAATERTYGEADMPRIVDDSRNNELRFNRDYKGQRLTFVGRFNGVTESLFGLRKHVTIKGFGPNGAYCFLDNADPVLKRMIDWRRGQQINVSGTISTTMFGDVALDDCSISSN